MARVVISSALIVDAMQSRPVREALRRKRDEKRRRADQLGAAEGVEMELETSEGTRPKGRPYARLTSRNVGQEWGDAYTERRRILGRSAES